ncbi:hypothetical protein [Paraburkholderia sp.]|uniref:hypothetical protein n=1 Tax=Paraburkholderia sp. TaxID=1926495 RepID=UPI003C7B0EEA
MADGGKKENSVEITCGVLVPNVQPDEFKEAVNDAIAYVMDGRDLDSFDDEGRRVARKLRARGLDSNVTVIPGGSGTGGELVDIVFHLVTSTGASVVAYDVWKHIVLPQLQVRWGRQALLEKVAVAKKAAKAEKKKAKEAEGQGESKKAKKAKKEVKDHGEKKGKKKDKNAVESPVLDAAKREKKTRRAPDAAVTESAQPSARSRKKASKVQE